MKKGDDGEDLLLDRFMDIREEAKAARREVIKLKEVQGLVLEELKRIKFYNDWLDGPNLDTLQQVFSSYMMSTSLSMQHRNKLAAKHLLHLTQHLSSLRGLT